METPKAQFQTNHQCDSSMEFVCLASKLQDFLLKYQADPATGFKPWSDAIDDRMLLLTNQLHVIGSAHEIAVCYCICSQHGSSVHFIAHRCEKLMVSLADFKTKRLNPFYHKGEAVSPALAATLLRFGLREAQKNQALSLHNPLYCIICTQDVK